MSRKKLFVLCVMIFFCFLFLLRVVQSSNQEQDEPHQCSGDVIIRIEECFSDFSQSVISQNPQNKGGDWPPRMGESYGGVLLLDYSEIKTSCGTDGHMTRFVECIDEVSSRCDTRQVESIFDSTVNHVKVKQMVPILCRHQNALDASSQCMAEALNKMSACQENVYAQVKMLLSETARNATAMLITQCRPLQRQGWDIIYVYLLEPALDSGFRKKKDPRDPYSGKSSVLSNSNRFSYSLAECQRTTVSEHCGHDLADLHVNFLLSFIPATCSDIDENDIIKMPSHAPLQSQPQPNEIFTERLLHHYDSGTSGDNSGCECRGVWYLLCHCIIIAITVFFCHL